MPHRVLIVHEEPAFARMIEDIFIDHGFPIVAEQAREAATAIRRLRRPAGRPDLVILGLLLDRRQGVEVLRFLRSEIALAAIPVIVTTVSPRETDAARSDMLGADFYLELPMMVEGFAEVVTRCRELIALRDEHDGELVEA